MKILALEPYYDGSHRAFIDGWIARSNHDITLLTLPGHHWKWRMRHASWTFAAMVRDMLDSSDSPVHWDAVLGCSMMNMAEFMGLAPAPLRSAATLCYFHENQLTYPDPHRDERDVHFALSNMISGLASVSIFNSAYHRDEFFSAMADLLVRMPDYNDASILDKIANSSHVIAPGVDVDFFERGDCEISPGPLRIVWAARWEHDKNFQLLADALDLLSAAGADFRLTVMGQSFGRVPEIFEATRRRHADRIDHFGWCDRNTYRQLLAESDVFVSTASHEFFGISAVEAAAAGAIPLLPNRLAYPEVFDFDANSEEFFYDGSTEDLARRLANLCEQKTTGSTFWCRAGDTARQLAGKYAWSQIAGQLDDQVRSATIKNLSGLY